MGKILKKYPLISTQKQIDQAIKIAKKKLKDNLTKKELMQLNDIQEKFRKGEDSLKKYSKKGKLVAQRLVFHNNIIKSKFKGIKPDTEDPDLYIIGGIPGSGKTEVLTKRIPEKTILIDNDDFKRLLAQKTKSPIKKYILAHASLLHEESDLLVNKSIDKAIKNLNDTTLDMTFATFDKGKNLIKRFKDKGYDIHFLGTQKYVHQTIPNIISRFLKKGRYVPPEVPAIKGNQINRNVLKARKLADTHIIADTSIKGKPRIISASPKLINKPIKVKKHKRNNLKNKRFVRKHRRRKSRFTLNYRKP